MSSKCTMLQKKVIDGNAKAIWLPTWEDTGVQACMSYCSDQMKALLDQDKISSAMCTTMEDHINWQNYNCALRGLEGMTQGLNDEQVRTYRLRLVPVFAMTLSLTTSSTTLQLKHCLQLEKSGTSPNQVLQLLMVS